jgi:protein-disulfide isomerase
LRLEPLLQQVLEKYPKDVKIVVKNFPLAMHSFARKAATAALSAKRQGKFWEFHEKLYENMKFLSDKKFLDIAEELNLNTDTFSKDMNDPELQKIISKDIQNGTAAGVRGTPTIFINGKRLTNRSLEGFQQMIDAELKK